MSKILWHRGKTFHTKTFSIQQTGIKFIRNKTTLHKSTNSKLRTHVKSSSQRFQINQFHSHINTFLHSFRHNSIGVLHKHITESYLHRRAIINAKLLFTHPILQNQRLIINKPIVHAKSCGTPCTKNLVAANRGFHTFQTSL